MMLSTGKSSESTETVIDGALREKARVTLDRAMNEEKGWVRVHAIEAEIALGEATRPRQMVEPDLAEWEKSPQRTGAWRVLAALAGSAEDRAKWLAKIEAVLMTDGSADRLQSLEGLCKLKVVLSGEVLARARTMAAGVEGEQPLGNWALVVAGDAQAMSRLGALLGSSDPVVRLRAAYALRWLKPKDPVVLKQLAAAAEAEATDSMAYPYLVSAVLVTDAAPARTAAWKAAAAKILAEGVTGARYEICQTGVLRGEAVELKGVVPLLDHADGDARIGASWLILSKAKGAGKK